MKILDLGCHDGYVSAWLARNFEHIERIDGVELMPEAARIAQERIDREVGAGEVKIGMAEDAPSLFEPGTYDVVIAFELIEHVVDVDKFLDVCESMLVEGGRVYISTPDGTFGAGQNPHHLRVYRSIDLAEVLRRRGNLEQMVVGNDGITFASYSLPTNGWFGRGEVAIFTGGGWQSWSPMDIETKGLGGSETAAVRLAQALTDLGYTVTVYGEVEQGCFRNVVFRHYSTFDPLERRAAVISSRLPEVFDRPVNAESRILWMHDTDCGPRLTPERAQHITRVITLSAWHAENVLNIYPFLLGKVEISSNGIIPSYFRGEEPARECRAIYSSSPDRGLDIVLEVWPEVREAVPDAELVYCYSDVYDAVANQQPHIAHFRERVSKLARQPGVRSLGSLSQPALARELRVSKVWVHPSFCTPFEVPFHETYCIGAVESAAAGCYRVGAAWGALKERRLDYYVPPTGEKHEPDREALVEGIVRGLKKAKFPFKNEWAMECTWLVVGNDFDRVISDDILGVKQVHDWIAQPVPVTG